MPSHFLPSENPALPSRAAAAAPSPLHILLLRVDSWNPGFQHVSTVSCLRKYRQCFIGHFALSFVSHCYGVRQALVMSSHTCSSRSEIRASESGCWARVQLCLLTISGGLCSACFAGFRRGDAVWLPDEPHPFVLFTQ